MSSPRITFQYAGGTGSGNEPRILLEQAPVPRGTLSLTDLANMLALVRSGISAATYIADSCPASIVDGLVVVPLTVFVWPSVPDLAYTLTAALPAWTTIGPAVAVEQERDFDLIVPEETTVDLPCLAAGVELNWQTPAITPWGAVIEPPAIAGFDPDRSRWQPISAHSGPINRIRLERQVFAVLRVRCRALGYRHAITMAIPKAADQKLTDIEETLTAAWSISDGSTDTAALPLTLPACVAALLEACEADANRTPGIRGRAIKPEELIPELRYSTCDGLPIGNVRWVAP